MKGFRGTVLPHKTKPSKNCSYKYIMCGQAAGLSHINTCTSLIPRPILFEELGKSLGMRHTLACIDEHMHTSVLTRIFRPKGTNNISDPAPHLECSDSQYQTLVACVPLLTKDSKLSLSSVVRAQTVLKFK